MSIVEYQTTVITLTTCDVCESEVTEVAYDTESTVCTACIDAWNDLTESTQEDLLVWYNGTPIDLEVRARLAKLYTDGNFRAYTCGNCSERQYDGSPESWGDFQGVLQSEGGGELCADCYGIYRHLARLAGED